MSLLGVILQEAAKDGPALIRAVVEAFGGVDNVRAILEAEYAATDAAVDVLEEKKLEEVAAAAKETTP